MGIIKIEKPGKEKITPEDLKKLEEKIQKKLADELKTFLSENGGAAILIDNKTPLVKVKIDEGFTASFPVECVFTLGEIEEAFEFISYLEEMKEHFDLTDDDVETGQLIPVLQLTGGVVYYANDGKHRGKLFVADNGDFGIKNIGSLNELFRNMVSADSD